MSTDLPGRQKITDFATEIGESSVGAGPNAAHVNTVLGRRGGAIEGAFTNALANPREGHTPFFAVLQPNLPVKPYTLFINKVGIAGDRHGELTWGAAHAGVAKGVAEAVADGIIERRAVDDLLLIVAVSVSPDAFTEAQVFANNTAATREALDRGKRDLPAIGDILDARERPWNAYFRESTRGAG
jgi:5,6,7,8-tetrahydromethanopterin hydro-lyase